MLNKLIDRIRRAVRIDTLSKCSFLLLVSLLFSISWGPDFMGVSSRVIFCCLIDGHSQIFGDWQGLIGFRTG